MKLPRWFRKPAAALPVEPRPGSSSLAGGAFWTMMRRVVILAACVDVLFFVLFRVLESPLLAWLNVLSVAMYAAAYALIVRRFNIAALVLIWLEVLGHAAAGTLLIGWESGFHYYLLMFIAAIVVSSSRGQALALVLALLTFYLGLDAVSRAIGPMTPLPLRGLVTVKWINIAIVFAMFSALGRFYVGTVVRAEKRLHLLATRDSLTGLFNRRHFHALADHVVARSRRAGGPVSLVLADVDYFKRINDAHGHDAGDKVLVHVGELLKRVCRDQDVLARWGGEEFLILLPDTDAAGAAAAAERMRQAAEASAVPHAAGDIHYTISFGATQLRADESLSDAVERADRAMYRSKSEGRNRVTSE
jgi:diguanylate cyclase (GGDEF)-like protein